MTLPTSPSGSPAHRITRLQTMGNKVLMLPWEKLDFLLMQVRSLSEGHTLEQSRIDREKSVTHASVFSSVKHEQPRMLLGKAPRPSRALSQLWGVTHGQGSGTQNAHWVRKLFHCFSFFFFFPQRSFDMRTLTQSKIPISLAFKQGLSFVHYCAPST